MSAEVVIVDDDQMVGELTQDLLAAAGFGTHLVRDSRMALQAVQEERPRLVILDILMPGLDGLSVLHQIKNDPQLAAVKVAVVSGKNFSSEVERAKSLGADLFIHKPYDIKTFTSGIIDLIGPPSGAASPGGPKSAISLRVWGPASEASTPCLSLEAAGRLFILDAGGGAAALGREILKQGKYKEAWLLLSHFHPDHVGGFGDFPLLNEEGFSLHVLGPGEPGKNLAALLREAMEKSFTAASKPITAKLSLHELREDTYELDPGLRVTAFYANHPSTTLGFILELGGRKIVYCPDSELYGEEVTALQDYDEKLGRLCRGADLLIHDARYNEADHSGHRKEGHSSAPSTAAFAADNEVARLVLFHADPAYSPQDLEALESAAKSVLEAKGARIPCHLAKDGLTLEF